MEKTKNHPKLVLCKDQQNQQTAKMTKKKKTPKLT